jgi:YVTN family beta-propeller protein
MAEGFSDGEAEAPDIEAASLGVKTFLIADVRGYTKFTQEHGDEAASRLTAAFAEATRAGVSQRGGEVIELRGDEALAVFGSARQALRAAVELQDRYAEVRAADPGLPLLVGIGLDAGEAVPLERGYRGAALNLAARLCSNAGPDEIIASEGVVHLAGKVEGLEYRDGARLRLKGLAEPVRVHYVVAEGAARRPRGRKAATSGARGKRGRLVWVVGAGIALAAVAAALVLALDQSSSAAARIDANSAGAINTGTNRLVKQVLVGSGPGRIASGAGAIWVVNVLDDTVSRVDPATSLVQQTIPVELDPTALAFGEGALWVTCSGTRSLLRINPETNTIVQHIRVGNGPSGVGLSPGTVWVTNRFDDTVTEIDASSGRVERTLAAGPSPSDVAYGLGALWIANESSSSVTRLDPRTGNIQTVPAGNGPDAVAVGAGSIWVANGLDGTVSRIDPSSNAVVSTISVGLGPSSVLVDRGVVWVADSYAGEISRIDPASNRVVKTIAVGNGPQGLAAAGGRIWLSARGAAAVHRGGTLRLAVSADLIDSLDPAIAYHPQSWTLLSITGDSLVGFKRVSGLDGGTLVPDLARSLPIPTDGGRTYTFQLRPGIRYSNGEPVRASDLRLALERDFLVGSPGTSFYTGLAGAGACSKSHCDLSKGVVADDRAGTVTLHLRAPDPELLYKLALLFARPVPRVPMKPLEGRGIPGTGPYMIASHKPSQIVLVRNPYFHEWSAAAQPDGYPDRIVWDLAGTPDQQLTAVESGKADYDPLTEIPWRDELATRYTAQVHIFPNQTTAGLFLNTRVAPFDNLAVRQAVSYAIDRHKAVTAFGGAQSASVTCQILPIGTPGYTPYCPYTQTPGSAWTAPDLTRARKLVASSGTRGEKVVVWAVAHLTAESMARLAVETLDELGYRASVKLISSVPAYFAAVSDPRNRAQIGFIGGGSDYPAASDWMSGFTCQATANGNGSASQLCNRGLDRAIARALVAQSLDPPAADASWASVDRRLTDLVPWVPLVNSRQVAVVSRRVGNVQYNPEWGTLIDQLWVR